MGKRKKYKPYEIKVLPNGVEVIEDNKKLHKIVGDNMEDVVKGFGDVLDEKYGINLENLFNGKRRKKR